MPPVIRNKNGLIYIDQTPLLADKLEETILTTNIASASGTLTVKSIASFAINQILLIGELGSEDSEIIKTHASTAPTGSTITLASNTTVAHNAQTKVYRILYDQIELSHATTATGSKSTLTTTGDGDGASGGILSLKGDKKNKSYNETQFTTGFYFARYKNSIDATFSGYTDALAFGGWDETTVGAIIDFSLRRNGITLGNEITRQFCYEEITDCMNEIQGKQLRWPDNQALNSIIGQTSRGSFITSLPTDIYDNDSNKSIIGVRIGNRQGLTYYDPLEWEERMKDIIYTQVRSAGSVGATSLALNNSYDFADAGSVNVYISGTKYNITYTGVTRDTVTGATGALTGVPASGTGSITVTIPADTYVYQNEKEGEPDAYTIRGGNLEIQNKPDASFDNMNIYMDYWKVATEVNSDGDVIDTQRYDLIKYWLNWKIRMQLENKGKLDFNNGDYLKYKERLNDAIRNKPRNLKYKMKPKINRISYGRFGGRVRPLVND